MREHIQTITRAHSLYPPLLREIAQPPSRLFVRGNVEILTYAHVLSVVGSRKHSEYGKRACEYLLPPLVRAGLVLVSGLAYGIDSLAHRACVQNNRPTIAVLGSGIDDASIYPRGNVRLAHEIIAKGGCLVSDYPRGTKAQKRFFPDRNRIVTGLTRATLVVQAGDKSGTLISARLALEANREVCAIPGPVTDPLSWGPNSLIQQGALLVHRPEDILMLFGLEKATAANSDLNQLSLEQAHIFKQLSSEPQHIDTIIELVHLPAPHVSSLLVELEMLGWVTNVGGMRYARK
jgi:DNA processing protein